MLKLHLRERLRDLEDRVHEAKRRGKDEFVALLSEVTEDALTVGARRNVLYGRYGNTFAIVLFERNTRLVVLSQPTFVTRRAHIDKGDFEESNPLFCGRTFVATPASAVATAPAKAKRIMLRLSISSPF